MAERYENGDRKLWPEPNQEDRRHSVEQWRRHRDTADEGGYGGGRERVEDWSQHGFGDYGWGGGRGEGYERPQGGRRDLPEGVRPAQGGPGWQDRFVRENAHKYGQSGGRPVVQRGASGSQGGFEHREQSLGDTRDVSARGGYGIRETENWGGTRDFSGRGPKNWRRSDAAIAEDVNQRLTDHPDIDATDIEVQVSDCEVTLSGPIEHRNAKRLAEEIAESVPGVVDVHNRLRVMSSVVNRER